MSIAASLNTLRWAALDQRRLINDGFGEGESFGTELMLPTYNRKQIGRRLPMSKRRVIFVRGAEGFGRVFQASSSEIDAGRAYAFLGPYFGSKSLFVMEGEQHVRAKQALFRLIRNTMQTGTDDLLFLHMAAQETFSAGTYPVLPRLQQVTCAFVLRNIFGEQGTTAADTAVREALAAVGEISATHLLLPALLRWTRRFGSGLAIRRRRLALRGFILERLKTIDVGDWERRKGGAAAGNRGEIVDNLLTILIAGFETASTALAWLLYELAAHPEVQDDLRAEIGDRLDDDPLDYLADDTSLLARSVTESLRLHPSLPFIIREVRQELPIEGGVARPGDYVVLSIEELHKRVFDTDGGDFRPDRFRTTGEQRGIATFGGGAKICPGRAVAVQQMRALTAILVSRYRIDTTRKTDPRVTRNRVSARPMGGMELSLTPAA